MKHVKNTMKTENCNENRENRNENRENWKS